MKSCLAPIEGKNLCFSAKFWKESGKKETKNAQAIRFKKNH